MLKKYISVVEKEGLKYNDTPVFEVYRAAIYFDGEHKISCFNFL